MEEEYNKITYKMKQIHVSLLRAPCWTNMLLNLAAMHRSRTQDYQYEATSMRKSLYLTTSCVDEHELPMHHH